MSVIVNIDHETGDTSQYTQILGGSDISVQAGAALASTSYGLQCVINDTTNLYGQKTITTDTSGVVRARFYIDPNSTSIPSAGTVMVLELHQQSGSQNFAMVYLRWSGTEYQIRGRVVRNAGTFYTTSDYTISDAPHYIELEEVRSGSGLSDGTFDLWIDGAHKETISNIDNDTRFASFNMIEMGTMLISATTSGTIYLDELIVNDDGSEIGPLEVISGTTCWGHITGVTESNTRTFVDNWLGTGLVVSSGDSERLEFDDNEYMESEVVNTGAVTVSLLINQYNAGNTLPIQYRIGDSIINCEAADWLTYSSPFVSSGYVQIRLDTI